MKRFTLKQLQTARENYIKPFRKKFESAKNQKKRAEVIAELITIDPSHLREPWIIRELEKWLRNYYDCQDFIEMVFVKAPKKRAMTPVEQNKAVRRKYLIMDIEKCMGENDSINRAIYKFLCNLPEGQKQYLGIDLQGMTGNFKNDKDIIDQIKDQYKYAKKVEEKKKDIPPWPYLGRDIEKDESGKIVISAGR